MRKNTQFYTHRRLSKASNRMKLHPLRLITISCLNYHAHLNLKRGVSFWVTLYTTEILDAAWPSDFKYIRTRV